MRVIVCGGRAYQDAHLVARVVALLPRDATVVHGGASGLDSLVAAECRAKGIVTEAHPAAWKEHGRRAGPLRNQRMADLGADLCIAFPGGRGTNDMARRATAAGIPVIEPPEFLRLYIDLHRRLYTYLRRGEDA